MAKKKIRQHDPDLVLLEVMAEEVVQHALPAIESRLSRRLAASEVAPDLARVAGLVVGDVQRLQARLEQARHAEGCAEAALARSRGERDEAAEQVYGVLSELRDVLLAVSRRRAGEAPAFMIPEVPQDPTPLLRTADRVLEGLRQPGRLVPEGSPVRLDAVETASELAAAAGALRRALPEVELRAAEVVLMREKRKEAEALFAADCGAGLRLLQALGEYGDRRETALPERAERIRTR